MSNMKLVVSCLPNSFLSSPFWLDLDAALYCAEGEHDCLTVWCAVVPEMPRNVSVMNETQTTVTLTASLPRPRHDRVQSSNTAGAEALPVTEWRIQYETDSPGGHTVVTTFNASTCKRVVQKVRRMTCRRRWWLQIACCQYLVFCLLLSDVSFVYSRFCGNQLTSAWTNVK